MPQAYIKGYLRHYRSEGDPRKPCVVLSNSLGTDLSMWDAQAEALAPHFHVLRYDTRGHGGSASHAGRAPAPSPCWARTCSACSTTWTSARRISAACRWAA